MQYTRFPASIATLYAEFFQQVKSAEASRDIADIKGSFVSKQIKGKTYWYLQHSLTGQQTQIYLGPESPSLLKRPPPQRRRYSPAEKAVFPVDTRRNCCS